MIADCSNPDGEYQRCSWRDLGIVMITVCRFPVLLHFFFQGNNESDPRRHSKWKLFTKLNIGNKSKLK